VDCFRHGKRSGGHPASVKQFHGRAASNFIAIVGLNVQVGSHHLGQLARRLYLFALRFSKHATFRGLPHCAAGLCDRPTGPNYASTDLAGVFNRQLSMSTADRHRPKPTS